MGEVVEGGGDGEKLQLVRGPQSWQSVHGLHAWNSEPDPPSSQSPSDAYRQVFTRAATGRPGGGGE